MAEVWRGGLLKTSIWQRARVRASRWRLVLQGRARPSPRWLGRSSLLFCMSPNIQRYHACIHHTPHDPRTHRRPVRRLPLTSTSTLGGPHGNRVRLADRGCPAHRGRRSFCERTKMPTSRCRGPLHAAASLVAIDPLDSYDFVLNLDPAGI